MIAAQLNANLDLSMRHYVANVYAFDQNVKSVLAVLDELGLRDNTVVVFSSDQGPPRPYGIGEKSNRAQSEGKGEEASRRQDTGGRAFTQKTC